MDKSKQAPIPEQSKQIPKTEKDGQSKRTEPTFVRGTIDPTTKKER